MMAARKPKLWTMLGLSRLGKEILRSRKEQAWSQDRLVEVIRERTGQEITKQTISRLERGGQMPERNTLAIIAAAQFIRSRAGIPYTESQLSDIASEVLNPESGTQELEPTDEEEEAALVLMETAPLPVVLKAIAVGTARLQLEGVSPNTSVTSPISKSATSTDNDVVSVGCEKMVIELSGDESRRLKALIEATLKQSGYSVSQLVENSVDIPVDIKEVVKNTLSGLVVRSEPGKLNCPDSVFKAIAYVCCQVNYWRSLVEPNINPLTYEGDTKALRQALNMPVNNHNHATS